MCQTLVKNTYFADSWFSRVETAEEAITEGLNYCETVNKSNKVFFLATFEKFMKEWTGGYRIVIKSSPIITGYIPLMSIGYECNSREVLRFIVTEGSGSTVPDDSYLSHYPENYSNVFLPSCLSSLPRHLFQCLKFNR